MPQTITNMQKPSIFARIGMAFAFFLAVIGSIVFSALFLFLFVSLAIIVWIRFWWLSRKQRKFQHNQYIDAEYEVETDTTTTGKAFSNRQFKE